MALPRPGPFRGHNFSVGCEASALVSRLVKSLDSRIGRTLSRMLINNDHAGIVSLSIDPRLYTNPDLFHRDWLAVNIMAKYPKFNLGIDTTKTALDSFIAAEALCFRTNRRLSSSYDTPTLGISGDSLIETARRKIAGLLGDFSWDEAAERFSFSGGATTRLRRSNGDAYYKFQGKPETTRRAAILGLCCIKSVPLWADQMRTDYGDDPTQWVTVVSGNRITTVPKNAKTDRTIAIEPDLNMYLQKGIGGVIRQRLRRVNVDLNDQSLNQRLACIGSVTGKLATLDLKAASDSVSIELVRRLLPFDWFEAMDLVRSHEGTMPSGEVVTFQKFSSMGNGFTFELESLIFWALCSSVTDSCLDFEHPVAVYGDDLVVPVSAAGFCEELLSYCGFDLNFEKSFVAGPFRESCGKHYFRGVDVTPFYIRDEIKTIPRLYWYANSLRRWAARSVDGYADPRYYGAYKFAIGKLTPRDVRWIPDGIGDVGLISTFTEACPSRVRQMWKFNVLLSGIGETVSVFDGFAYLRALMHRQGSCDGTGFVWKGNTFHQFLERIPLTDLLVKRERKWVRKSSYSTSRWVDAPIWCVD